MGNGAVADPERERVAVQARHGGGAHRRTRAHGLAPTLLALLAFACPAPARAEDHTVLVRLLEDAHSFRVRARAALALGSSDHGADDATVTALEGALRDPHAAVREAAAATLGRVGSRRSVAALRRASSDAAAPVSAQAKNALREIAARETLTAASPRVVVAPIEPTAPAHVQLDRVRYVLVIGEMRNRAAHGGRELETVLAARVLDELRQLPYVAVLTLAQMTEQLSDEIQRRKLPAFRIDGTIGSVETTQVQDEQRMRCEVSLLVMDEPDRTLRSMLKGAATGSEQLRGAREAQLRTLAHKALKGAVRSALGNMLEAVEAASIRRDLGLNDLRAEASLDHPRDNARR